MFKERFPIFKRHPELVFLDSASTSQRLDRSLEAGEHYALEMNANVHRALYPMGEAATTAFEEARQTVARFLNAADARSIVFTSGTTESLNLLANSWGRTFLKAGDEVLLSELEHHSNLVPWQQVCHETGATLKVIPVTEEGLLDESSFETLFNPKTRMVSITGLSNTLGTLVDLKKIVKAARAVGALVCIDGAQLVAHSPVDVQELDLDFLAFSGHKIYSQTGLGVLYGKPEHFEKMPPVKFGGSMISEVRWEETSWADFPQKFEGGTPNIAGVLSLAAALEFMMEMGWEKILSHETALMEKALELLPQVPNLRILGPGNAREQRGVLSFVIEGIHPHDVGAMLGLNNICVRAGHHCTMPLMQRLHVPATTRVSFGIYNTVEDLEQLKMALIQISGIFS